MREVIAFKDAYKRLSEVLALVKKGQITDAKFKLDHVFTTLKYAHELGIPANIYNYYLKRLSVLNQMFLDYIAGKEKDLAKMVRHIQYTLDKMFNDIMDLYLRRIVKKPEEFKPPEKKEEKPPERKLTLEDIIKLRTIMMTACQILNVLDSEEFDYETFKKWLVEYKYPEEPTKKALEYLQRKGLITISDGRIRGNLDKEFYDYAIFLIHLLYTKGQISLEDMRKIANRRRIAIVKLQEVAMRLAELLDLTFDERKGVWRFDYTKLTWLL